MQKKQSDFIVSHIPLLTSILAMCALSVGCEDEPTEPSSEPAAGTMTAGSSGGSVAGEAVAGEATSGEAAGEATAGDTAAGEVTAGDTAAGSANAGDMIGGEAIAGEGSDAGTEDRMPSCLISCAEFVECTIKQCPGYDESDDALLMEECLGLCNPNLARLFDQLTGCPEKIRFASTVRTDFINFCDSVTEGFCETYIATCGEWLGTADCEEQYNGAPLSGDEYTSGAHRQCYEYHLGSAQRGLEEGDEERVQRGCERAAGLNTCVDEE